jgi:hypothetical protein
VIEAEFGNSALARKLATQALSLNMGRETKSTLLWRLLESVMLLMRHLQINSIRTRR